MDYELYVRILEPSVEGARALRDAVGSSLGPPIGRGARWRICHGTEETQVRLVPPDPAWWQEPGDRSKVGMDLVVPAGATHAHLEAVCDWLFTVARPGTGLEIYDPQLGRPVTKEDRGAIEARATELGAYLVDTLGEASGHGTLEEPVKTKDGRRWLWGTLLVVLGWIVLQRLVC